MKNRGDLKLNKIQDILSSGIPNSNKIYEVQAMICQDQLRRREISIVSFVRKMTINLEDNL